jgi:hypothetical protein
MQPCREGPPANLIDIAGGNELDPTPALFDRADVGFADPTGTNEHRAVGF